MKDKRNTLVYQDRKLEAGFALIARYLASFKYFSPGFATETALSHSLPSLLA
jgi:hypothetical protein